MPFPNIPNTDQPTQPCYESLALVDLSQEEQDSVIFREPRRMRQKIDEGRDISDEPVAIMQDMKEAGVPLIDFQSVGKLERILQNLAAKAAYNAYLHVSEKEDSEILKMTYDQFVKELHIAGHFPMIRKENKKELTVCLHKIICKGHVVIEKFYRDTEEYETDEEEDTEN
jgi:hypothetical protein